jgi:rhodanese-related sulfurtransferase
MIRSLTAQQARELIHLGQVDIVDVREPSEWAGGHLPGARLVPLGQLRADPRKYLTQDGILFVCAAGVRSQTAAKAAEAAGFQQLYNLASGTRGWAGAGLPLVVDENVGVAQVA